MPLKDHQVLTFNGSPIERVKIKIHPSVTATPFVYGACVYAIERDGLYKVGCTENLSQRARMIMNAGSTPITVVALARFKDQFVMKQAEKNAHLLLSGFRTHGEWFDTDMTNVRFAVRTAEFCAKDGDDRLVEILSKAITMSGVPLVPASAPPPDDMPPNAVEDLPKIAFTRKKHTIVGHVRMRDVELSTGLSLARIKRAVREGRLPVYRDGQRLLFKEDDVRRYVASILEQVPADFVRDADPILARVIDKCS